MFIDFRYKFARHPKRNSFLCGAMAPQEGLGPTKEIFVLLT
jgi:hypothetical protein